MPYKDRKVVCTDLKKIYGAVNLDDVEYAKKEFREKWNKKYLNILKSWYKNWSENSPNPRQFFRLMIQSEKSFL